jgi:hypothetical protein
VATVDDTGGDGHLSLYQPPVRGFSCLIDLRQNMAVIAHNFSKMFARYIKMQ